MSVYRLLRGSKGLGVAAVASTLVLAAAATYYFGGTKTSLPHLFYVPIAWASALFGVPGGVVTGLASGLLAGPWMPSDVEGSVPQSLENWLGRAAVFVAVGALVGTLFIDLRRRIEELRRLNEQTVTAFVQAVDAKDPYTAEHSAKVAFYARSVAEELGLSREDAERVRRAALLHDIGKIAVPESILHKPGKLDPDEWAIVRRHPVDSANIIAGIGLFHDYIPGVRHHHERMDGGGYPDRLRGDEVPLDARIISVADAYDAMTSERAYRPAMTPEQALEELHAGSGRQFDPEAVAALTKVVRRLGAEERATPFGSVGYETPKPYRTAGTGPGSPEART